MAENEESCALAVVFTCHNRKAKTLRCIESLKRQKDMPAFDLYVCDDASTDGTKEAVKEAFPGAVVLDGTGNLFFSRGMRVAMDAAVRRGYDEYLMVNDDVEFFDGMWSAMRLAREENGGGAAGCTLSRATGLQSYGGRRFIRSPKGDWIDPMLAPSAETYVPCDLANWNCFLIDRDVVEAVGLIDGRYEHAMGDYDYCFRMREKGFGIVLAKAYVGYCERNTPDNTFRDSAVPRMKRIGKLFAPNGLPVRSWYRFTAAHYRRGKARVFLAPYLKYLGCILLGKDCRDANGK